jgi:hypothetical protein
LKKADLIPELEVSLEPNELEIKILGNKPEGTELNHRGSTKLFVGIWFPVKEDSKNDDSFMIPTDEKAIISSTILPFSEGGRQYRKAIDRFSTLPYGSIPDHDIDFFKHFIRHLEDKWVGLCDLGEKQLTDCVSRILRIPLN